MTRARSLLMAMAALAGAWVSGAGAQTPTVIRLGGTFPGEEPVWYLAKKPELFPNDGKAYTLNWSVFQGTAPITQAMIANAVDCGTQSPISFAVGTIEGGLQADILGAFVDEKPGYFSVFWAVEDGSPIHRVEDLKGHTIGTTVVGGGVYYHLRMELEAHGLDPDKDVRLVELPFGVQDQALRSQRIDAAVYAQPWGGAGLKNGGIRVLFTSADVFSPLVNVFETCRKDFVDRNDAAVRAFMADYAAAMAYAVAHPDETKALVSSVTKIPVDTLNSFMLTHDDFYRPEDARPNFDAIQAMWTGYAKAGIISKPLNVHDYQRLDVTPGTH